MLSGWIGRVQQWVGMAWAMRGHGADSGAIIFALYKPKACARGRAVRYRIHIIERLSFSQETA